jgi:hypothetical protein
VRFSKESMLTIDSLIQTVVKCSKSLSNRVSNIIRMYRSYEVCCLYGFFVYHILSCFLDSIYTIVCMVVCFVCFCLIF